MDRNGRLAEPEFAAALMRVAGGLLEDALDGRPARAAAGGRLPVQGADRRNAGFLGAVAEGADELHRNSRRLPETPEQALHGGQVPDPVGEGVLDDSGHVRADPGLPRGSTPKYTLT